MGGGWGEDGRRRRRGLCFHLLFLLISLYTGPIGRVVINRRRYFLSPLPSTVLPPIAAGAPSLQRYDTCAWVRVRGGGGGRRRVGDNKGRLKLQSSRLNAPPFLYLRHLRHQRHLRHLLGAVAAQKGSIKIDSAFQFKLQGVSGPRRCSHLAD